MNVKKAIWKWLESEMPRTERVTYVERSGKTDRDATDRDARNALQLALDLDSKFNALAKTLGVIVVVTDNGPDSASVVESDRENGLLGNAQRYTDAAMTAKAVMNLQRRLLEQQAKIVRELVKEFGIGGE